MHALRWCRCRGRRRPVTAVGVVIVCVVAVLLLSGADRGERNPLLLQRLLSFPSQLLAQRASKHATEMPVSSPQQAKTTAAPATDSTASTSSSTTSSSTTTTTTLPVDVQPLIGLYDAICELEKKTDDDGHMESDEHFQLTALLTSALIEEHEAAGPLLVDRRPKRLKVTCDSPDFEALFTGRQRTEPRVIVDVVHASHELALLEARTRDLRGVVAQHLVVESSVTQWGRQKPLLLQQARVGTWNNTRILTVESCRSHSDKVQEAVAGGKTLGSRLAVQQAYSDCIFKTAIGSLSDGLPSDTWVMLSEATDFPSPFELQHLRWCELRRDTPRMDVILDRTVMGCLYEDELNAQCSLRSATQTPVPLIRLPEAQAWAVGASALPPTSPNANVFGGLQLLHTGTIPQLLLSSLLLAEDSAPFPPASPDHPSFCNMPEDELAHHARAVAQDPLWWLRSLRSDEPTHKAPRQGRLRPPSQHQYDQDARQKILDSCRLPWLLQHNPHHYPALFCQPRTAPP